MKTRILILFFLLFFTACSGNKTAQQNNSNTARADPEIAELNRQKEKLAPFFKPMHVEKGDWLESFPEEGQTFDEYLKANPTLPTAGRKIIYIQPMGQFTPTQNKVLQLTADYMKVFYNLPVKLNALIKLDGVPKDARRRNQYSGQEQVKTSYFLEDRLPKLIPADAAAFICFTNIDLYPGDNWNYVFGQASLESRVGVWSMARYGNPDVSADAYRLFLIRTLKVAMHETGHMFSIRHCTKYLCDMSGSISMEETDRQPIDVCPEDMAKIAWAMKYKPAERFRNLAKFWDEQGVAELRDGFLKRAEAAE